VRQDSLGTAADGSLMPAPYGTRIWSTGGMITVKWTLNYSEKKLFQCHFVQHNSHVDCTGMEHRLLQWEARNRLPELGHGIIYTLLFFFFFGVKYFLSAFLIECLFLNLSSVCTDHCCSVPSVRLDTTHTWLSHFCHLIHNYVSSDKNGNME